MIQQGAITVLCLLQLLQQVRMHAHVKGVDLEELLELVRVTLMVRNRVMTIGDADLRIRAVAALPTEHE